jgi:hypothetical protein
VVREDGDVGPALAQRGDLDLHHAQPIVQILPETPLLALGAQVEIRRRDDAHVDGARVGGAERADLPVLQYAQQAHLHARMGLAHLVEEHRATVSDLEQALLVRVGTGERSARVAEELALEQRVRQRRAIFCATKRRSLRGPL